MKRFQRVYVTLNLCWLVVLCFVVFLVGWAVGGMQAGASDSTCAYCGKPLCGHVNSYHKACFQKAEDAAYQERVDISKAQEFMRPDWMKKTDGGSNGGRTSDIVGCDHRGRQPRG